MEYLKVGEIVNTHGIKGEVKIYPYTDDIINLSKTKFFYIDNVKTKVKKCSVFKNMLIVSLDNVCIIFFPVVLSFRSFFNTLLVGYSL